MRGLEQRLSRLRVERLKYSTRRFANSRELIREGDASVEVDRVGGVGHLAVADVLPGLPYEKLAGDQLNIVRRLDAPGNGDVNLDKMREVHEGIPLSQPLDVVRWEGRRLRRASFSNVSGRMAPSRWTCNSTFGMARMKAASDTAATSLYSSSPGHAICQKPGFSLRETGFLDGGL